MKQQQVEEEQQEPEEKLKWDEGDPEEGHPEIISSKKSFRNGITLLHLHLEYQFLLSQLDRKANHHAMMMGMNERRMNGNEDDVVAVLHDGDRE